MFLFSALKKIPAFSFECLEIFNCTLTFFFSLLIAFELVTLDNLP